MTVSLDVYSTDHVLSDNASVQDASDCLGFFLPRDVQVMSLRETELTMTRGSTPFSLRVAALITRC